MSQKLLLTNANRTTPLRWWAGAFFLVLSVGFCLCAVFTFPDDPLMAMSFHIVAIDMLLLPIGAIVMVLIVAPQRITWARIGCNIVPFVVCCPWCLVLRQTWYTYSIAGGMIAYMVAMMVYTLIQEAKYEHELKNEYSSLLGRSAKWLIGVVVYMGLIMLDFALVHLEPKGWDKLIYVVLNIISWNIVFIRVWQMVLQRENVRVREIDTGELAQEKKEDKARNLLLSEDTENFTQRLTELIEQEKIYSQEDLTRDDIARKIGMSHTNFTKLLKETTGQSFYEYINNVRISKATEMIKDGKMDIWSVGQIVGYRYRSTFYRAFAARHGCTPAEYMARNGKSS